MTRETGLSTNCSPVRFERAPGNVHDTITREVWHEVLLHCPVGNALLGDVHTLPEKHLRLNEFLPPPRRWESTICSAIRSLMRSTDTTCKTASTISGLVRGRRKSTICSTIRSVTRSKARSESSHNLGHDTLEAANLIFAILPSRDLGQASLHTTNPISANSPSPDLGPTTLEVADSISAISLRSAQGPL